MIDNLSKEKRELFETGYQIMQTFSEEEKKYLFSKIMEHGHEVLIEDEIYEMP